MISRWTTTSTPSARRWRINEILILFYLSYYLMNKNRKIIINNKKKVPDDKWRLSIIHLYFLVWLIMKSKTNCFNRMKLFSLLIEWITYMILEEKIFNSQWNNRNHFIFFILVCLIIEYCRLNKKFHSFHRRISKHIFIFR